MPDKWEYPWYAAWDLAARLARIFVPEGASHQTGWTALVTRCIEQLAQGRERTETAAGGPRAHV
jgi:hypothetical protein